MSDLNPRQKEAIHYIDGPLLVLAGAGSGKTRVITQKIAHLITECDINPRNITAVTFTNKAAREMKARAAALLKNHKSEGLNVSTFHTLGLNIIRREHSALGIKPGFSIFDAQDAETLLKELIHRQNGSDDRALKNVQFRISDWKNSLTSPAQAISKAEDSLELTSANLYRDYQRSLRAYNAVDFDDLISLPVQLLQQEAEILDRWQNRIRYMLVDEYQDTNHSQYELVRLLVGVRQALTAVGDDDQSIYSWRGARPENLEQLKEDFPRIKIVKLEQNYRSTGRILKAANTLIANNPHVLEKRLWSDLGPGEPIRILSCSNENDEAERVALEIIRRRAVQRAKHGDFAILYRGNHQARLFERALRNHKIPYHLSGGTSFFARTEVKDILAYLRLMANPTDDAAFLRIVNTPRREIGPTTLERLATYATERDIRLFAACSELGLSQHLPEHTRDKLETFANWITNYAQQAENDDPVKAVKALIQDMDYMEWLYNTSASKKTAERRMENINELTSWMEALQKGELQEQTLSEMLNHMMLVDMLNQDDDAENDQVHLMTLHAAKGLEFPHVFLVGAEEELLPHRSSIEEDNITEERRLAYVGITRARQTLSITLARKRKRYGEFIVCEPSRFLEELPTEDIEWEGKKSNFSKEEQQKRGAAHLADMRKLLNNT